MAFVFLFRYPENVILIMLPILQVRKDALCYWSDPIAKRALIAPSLVALSLPTMVLFAFWGNLACPDWLAPSLLAQLSPAIDSSRLAVVALLFFLTWPGGKWINGMRLLIERYQLYRFISLCGMACLGMDGWRHLYTSSLVAAVRICSCLYHFHPWRDWWMNSRNCYVRYSGRWMTG